MIIGSEYCNNVFILLCIIFLLIALIHFFWALGGKWGFDKVLPTKENGERLFTPKRIHSFLVGVGFMVIIFLLGEQLAPKSGVVIPYAEYLLYFIAAIFFLRAVGEFKYVGFFKKIKNTSFAKSDTWFFSPLCLLISILILMLIYGDCRIMPFVHF